MDVADNSTAFHTNRFPLPPDSLDVLIIGAGINGVGMLWELRDRGFERVKVIDQADGVGGTWYWNRYPGCRLDSESYTYGFFKDPQLAKEWRWPEYFASQSHVEEYINHVVERHDLRRFIELGVKVTKALWNEKRRLWTVETLAGKSYSARILITALGILSHPQYPSVPGIDSFKGTSAHTARWPRQGIEVKDKRVAVIGTGSSGVQVIPELAKHASELVVFQRTPNWVAPLNNSAIPSDEYSRIIEKLDEIYATVSQSHGFPHSYQTESAYSKTPEERRQVYERLWQERGFAKYLGNYREVTTDPALNSEFQEFVSSKIRTIVKDPQTAEKLIPTDHPYGGKRTPFGTNYFETYNLPHVSLVDLRESPLQEVTPSGLKTTTASYDFDVMVWATGFDTLTGAWDNIDFYGNGGKSLKEAWRDGPYTYVGSQTPGFPNLFKVAGPHTIGGNIPRAAEVQIHFLADLLATMRQEKSTRVEADQVAARKWTSHAIATGTRATTSKETDYNWGANTKGKKIVFRGYLGGIDGLRKEMDASRDSGFSGFLRDTDDPGRIKLEYEFANTSSAPFEN